MSEITTLARPYAKAAFDYAMLHKHIMEWSQFLQMAASVIAAFQVKNLLSNPKINLDQIIDLIVELCAGDISTQQKNFLYILKHYSRFNLLPEIAVMFEQFKKELEKVIKVNITSAFPISESQKKKFVKALSIRLQRDVSLDIKIDHSIIGGAIIQAGDFVIDGSVKNQLERLKATLLA